MAGLQSQLKEVEQLIRMKHQAGRHDQKTHDPHKGGEGDPGYERGRGHDLPTSFGGEGSQPTFRYDYGETPEPVGDTPKVVDKTPKPIGKTGVAMRVRNDIPGDYVDQAMLDLLYGGVELKDTPYPSGLPAFGDDVEGQTLKEVAKGISKRTGLSEQEASDALELWSLGLAENMSSTYYGSKRGVAEEFGLEDTLPDWFKENESKVLSSGAKQRSYDNSRSTAGVVAQAMYEDTQKRLADAGIKEVTVYRGHISEASRKQSVGDAVGVTSTPVSSWSLDGDIASLFASREYALGGNNAGVVLQATVPASRVLSYYKTGYGTPGEFEVVVLEDPSAKDRALVTKRYIGGGG